MCILTKKDNQSWKTFVFLGDLWVFSIVAVFTIPADNPSEGVDFLKIKMLPLTVQAVIKDEQKIVTIQESIFADVRKRGRDVHRLQVAAITEGMFSDGFCGIGDAYTPKISAAGKSGIFDCGDRTGKNDGGDTGQILETASSDDFHWLLVNRGGDDQNWIMDEFVFIKRKDSVF